MSDNIGYVDDPYRQVPRDLTVTDLERLAKAGVRVDFKDVARQVVPDHFHSPYGSEPAPEPLAPTTLEESFWQRWRRAHIAKPYEGLMLPYQIHAHEHGDKVFVMVCPHTEAPFILEDDRMLYPSDALMAKLAIYEKVTP